MGETRHDGLAIPGRVVLAHELPFNIGMLTVHPATRQVECDGNHATIEPRVMQVLVALGRASGSIVTRDELIDRCWDGRIVSDDAINRVLSRIRQIANGIGGGSFAMETIARVGYRLNRASEGANVDLSAPPLPKTSSLSRRRLVIGASFAAVALGSG